jgi:hypothetical protein
MAYNWLYTSWNDNEYILFLIIVILFFIIIDFKLLTKKKKSTFIDVRQATTNAATTNAATTNAATTNAATTNAATTNAATTKPITTKYSAPTATNIANNLFVTPEEKEKMRHMWVQLDGDEESLPYKSDTSISNDILKFGSNLFSSNLNTSNVGVNYAQIGNWATIDELGKSMTDTLGGVNSNLGYTLLDEQLGTFKAPTTYDNTQNYKTSMNPETVAGSGVQGAGGNYQKLGTSPIFMQKDFAGVANIFAPNIYVSNAPLQDNGMPDISFTSGDGKYYSV